MVNIYTVSDKSLMGKQINILSAYLAECFFKNNIKIAKQCILPSSETFENIVNCEDGGSINVFLVDKGNKLLNEFICSKTNSVKIENPYLKNAIYDYYRKIGQPVEKDCECEWKISQLARAIINSKGLTQGYLLTFKNDIYCVLPNDYDQARQMFDDVVLDFILQNQKKKYKNYTFKTFGLTESGIATILNEEIKNKNKVSINLFSKPLEVDIVIKSLQDNEEIDNIAQKVFLKLDKYIYSASDVPIEQVVYKLLKLNDLKVSFVEDITAGLLASRLVEQADDAKKLVEQSLVILDKEAKIKYFNLTENDFDENGGVTPNMVYNMTAKMLGMSSSNVVVSAVGDIYTKNNSTNNGLCYIAVGDKREIHVFKNIFKGTINEIMESITVASYFYLIKKLKKNDFHFEQTTV